MTFDSRMFDSIDLQNVPRIDSLILSNIFLCNLLLVFGWQHLYHGSIQISYLFFKGTSQAGKADLLLYFQIKSFQFFCRNSFFGFCLANSECDAYLAVDHSLVYNSYPRMFLLFVSLMDYSRKKKKNMGGG